MFNVAKKSLNLGSLVYHYLKLRSYPPPQYRSCRQSLDNAALIKREDNKG